RAPLCPPFGRLALDRRPDRGRPGHLAARSAPGWALRRRRGDVQVCRAPPSLFTLCVCPGQGFGAARFRCRGDGGAAIPPSPTAPTGLPHAICRPGPLPPSLPV